MIGRTTMLRLSAALALTAAAVLPHDAAAQAYAYPSFQQPRVTAREYNFGVADGGNAGTSLLFQWREGMSARQQLSLDVGIADPDGGDNIFFAGGQLAHQITTSSSQQQPLDVLFTAGLNAAFGNDATLLRVPIGVSLGHRFPLDGGIAITPYVHPRASIDFLRFDRADGRRDSDSEININFDLGASVEFSSQLALRVSAMFGGSDQFYSDDAFGLSLAWTPAGLRR